MDLIDAKTSDRGRRTALTFPSKTKKKEEKKEKNFPLTLQLSLGMRHRNYFGVTSERHFIC
jgi:hypothetical protein